MSTGRVRGHNQSDTAKLAWLGRRVGFGLAPGDMARRTEVGLAAVVQQWTTPADPPAPEGPFRSIAATRDPRGSNRTTANRVMVADWLDYYRTTERPLDGFMHLFWHDHFAVSNVFVPVFGYVARHLEVLRVHAMGNYGDLLRAVSTDPAMLHFLDGVTSTGAAPNENFARELMELYSLGLGPFDEADVVAAATALTGWVVNRGTGQSRFNPARHDPTPQTLVGVEGVNDVDSVIDAVLNHPACPVYIAGKVARAILGGEPDAATVADLAAVFADNDLEIAPLVRATLEIALEGGVTPEPLGPAAWVVTALKVTGGTIDPARLITGLRAGGQVPGTPPNVGGYPPPAAWLSASAHASRLRLASFIVGGLDAAADVVAEAASGEFAALAVRFGLLGGFAPSTQAAMRDLLADVGPQGGRAVLVLALTAPEVVVV
ncbi:MAG: DUF1800 family protein [Acidimicrobiales bacterium]|nr:DUF1800 family protein [Acidimicrobiales bacterium]